jgi:hypothetical protein
LACIVEVFCLRLIVPALCTRLAIRSRATSVIAWNRNPESSRTKLRLRGRSQVGDHGSHDIRRRGLRSRVTICLHPDRDQADNGDQTKGGDTDSERYLNKGKRGDATPG